MISAQNIEVASGPSADVFYIESSLASGVTISEYRRSRPPRPSLWRRLGLRSRR